MSTRPTTKKQVSSCYFLFPFQKFFPTFGFKTIHARHFVGRKVAIKIQKLTPESQPLIVEEYRVLRDLSKHQNFPDFFGVYRKRSGKKSEYDQVWFVLEVSRKPQ